MQTPQPSNPPANERKGKTNNPNGRPQKGRALSDALTLKGLQRVKYGGKTYEAREALAAAMWEMAIDGVTYIDGNKRTVNVKLQFEARKFLYNQIDGPPQPDSKVEVNVGSGAPGLTADEEAAFDRVYSSS